MKAIPLICTTTIDIPMILEIQKSRTVYIYNEDEDACLALGIATAGRKGINCIIDKSISN